MYRRFIKTLSLVLSCVMVICNIQVTHIHAEEQYQRSKTETSGSVTMKVEWNDPVLGQPTTFHVSATGGSGSYLFRMDAPSYSNPNEMAYESVADPSRGEWMNYTSECDSTDYFFTMTASGTYNFRFYLMDKIAGVYYLRVSTYIQVSDSNHPSVRSIVQSAVAQCNNATDGSDYQKALWLHDWLLNQLEYDNTLKWSSAESALTRGLGTCQAYESAYSMLLSTAGIENAETRDTYDGHTWNAMKLDGEWYQVDCTWDDSNDNWYNFDQRRLYFGLTDELMAIAHPGYSKIYTVNGYGTRSTSLKNNYFVKSGEAQQWVDSYKDRIQNSLNSKQTQFSIQADNSTYPSSIYKIQNGIIAYVMNQNEWFVNGKKVNLVATVNDNKFDFDVTYPIECTKHEWDEGKVTTEPTCTEEGIKTYTCKNCATTKTEKINAFGHNYSNEWTIDKEATCQEEGSNSHHCTRCDDKKDVTVIPKSDHHFDSGVETTQATCTKAGVKTYTCRDCKTTKTETIKALDHDYSNEWTIDKVATCTQEGNKSHHCIRCDDRKDVTVIEKSDHRWQGGMYGATCTETGLKSRTCMSCGKTEIEILPVLGHEYSKEWTVDKESTCLEEGSKSHHCIRCDSKVDVTSISKSDHKWRDEITTEPTCTKKGLKTYFCIYCNKSKTESIPAKGHEYSELWTIDKEATCKEEGSMSRHCAWEDSVTDVKTIAKLEHKWECLGTVKESTCTENGLIAYWCKVCDERKEEPKAALGHSFRRFKTTDKVPTCKEEGSESYHCYRCDAKQDITVLPKLGHKWDDGKTTTQATCIKDGVKTYTCKDCKTTKTETIKALGHDYSSEWTIDKAATCTQEGSKSHHCTRCDAKKDVTVVSKVAHNWSSWSVVEQATTKKEGKERRTCRTCNSKEERSNTKLKVETQSMYRLYNSNSGEHFYTANVGEKNHLANIGWIYEGIGWNAPKTSDYPVYRLYNGNGGEHHYTMNKAEKDMLVRAGWKYEGIGWYSADPKDSNSIPLLREYNPNAFANNHNYTTSKPEHNWLISLGWKDEGKAWYALN